MGSPQDGPTHLRHDVEDGNSAVGGLPTYIAGNFSFQRFSRISATPENLAQAVLNSLSTIPSSTAGFPNAWTRYGGLLAQREPAARATEALLPLAAVRLICGVDESRRGPLAGTGLRRRSGVRARDGAPPAGIADSRC